MVTPPFRPPEVSVFGFRRASALESPVAKAHHATSGGSENLKEIVGIALKDKRSSFIIVWLERAKSPLELHALETAVALFLKPGCTTLKELNEYRPSFTEEHLVGLMGKMVKVDKGAVSFTNESVKHFLTENRILESIKLPETGNAEFAVAKACIRYLGLDDFRDLPVPVGQKGRRSELARSDPFLSYASKNWHLHVQSAEEAKSLEPMLDKIIDPARNNVYLWADQCSEHWTYGCSRRQFRSRCEIAVEYDIQWLTGHLLEMADSNPEDLFPARDLKVIARKAPKILRFLIQCKPDYYSKALTKNALIDVAQLRSEALETLQAVLPKLPSFHLPAEFFRTVCRNRKGDSILKYLFSQVPGFLITQRMLEDACANEQAGEKILSLFFLRDPSIRVSPQMIYGAISFGTDLNLRLLLRHDPDTPISEDMLKQVVKCEVEPAKLKVLLGERPGLPVPPSVIELAAKMNRYDAIKLIFDTCQLLEVTESILRNVAESDGHELDTAEFLLTRCPDPKIITEEVLTAGINRINSPDKMVALLLQYNPSIQISDEMLICSAGKVSSHIPYLLFEHSPRRSVPPEVVDIAIKAEKDLLTKSWYEPDSPSLLGALRKHVPGDPYLMETLISTDLTPPQAQSPVPHVHETDLPDAASKSNLLKVEELLEQGIDINTTHGRTCPCDRNRGRGTALQRAVTARDVGMTKFLLEHGANPDIQKGRYGNPLQEASWAGDLELVRLLIEHKAEVNLLGGRFGSPLFAAARANDVKGLRYMMENGADINIDDRNGWTPYLYALAYGCHDTTRALVEVDKSLPDLAELIALPPVILVKAEKESTVEISADGLTIKTDTANPDELRHRIHIRANHPIIPPCSSYFEMTIIRLGGQGVVGIGLCTSSSRSTGMPGWSKNSWAYHGDDGHVFDEGSHYLQPPYPTYGVGDVVGCGVDFQSKTCFFTKNGQRLVSKNGEDVAFSMMSGPLYPAIGVGDEGAELRVNFGEEAFMYQF